MARRREENMSPHRRAMRREARVISLNLVSYSRYDDEGVLTEAAMGRTLDISPGGIRLEVERHYPLSSVIDISIALRDNIITVKGRVVHLEELKNGKIAMGIQFVEMEPTIRDMIAKFLG